MPAKKGKKLAVNKAKNKKSVSKKPVKGNTKKKSADESSKKIENEADQDRDIGSKRKRGRPRKDIYEQPDSSEVIKRPVGRPTKWTDEKLEELGDTMLEWAKKSPKAYTIVQFCKEQICKGAENCSPNQVSMWAKANAKFKNKLSEVKAVFADRMISELNAEGTHPAFFNKYIRFNDPLLDEHTQDVETKEATEMMNKSIQIIDYSKVKIKEEKEKGNEI